MYNKLVARRPQPSDRRSDDARARAVYRFVL